LESLSEKYLTALFEAVPPLGTFCGLHEYDGRLPDLSKAGIASRVEELKSFKVQAEALQIPESDKEAHFDRALLLRCINKELFEIEEMRDHERNPVSYGYLTDVSSYIKRDYAPLEERLETVVTHLEQIPAALKVANENLDTSLARPVIEVSLDIFKGAVTYIESDVAAQFENINNPALSVRFAAARAISVAALNEFVERLEKRLPLSHNNFAIGPDKYRKMLYHGELVDMPLEELLEVGRQNLNENRALLVKLAEKFAPGRPVKEVMGELIRHHPTAEGLIPDTVQKLEEVRQFLIDHHIISIPSEIRCIVAETPPFMRWGFAFMDTPGSFEQVATQSYYYITPVETHWTEQQKEEWLTKFDYFTLQDVSVHEAYPGHYLHYLHFRNIAGRLRRSMWSANYSYSHVEGWAHYTEQMMIEEGYGKEDPRYQLAQLLEALLRNSRYVVSIMMHTQGMTVEEATRFFMENAFMEETPAASEARRGTFDPGYLNYTLGKLLIFKLRDDYKREKGASFNLREFHDHFLSFGAPPIPLVRRMMLENDDGKLL
jgi:uncharacterized protein (DUF885 family)